MDKNRIITTDRLYLRKLDRNDFRDLCDILMDETVMYAYEHAFDKEEAEEWLERQLTRYEEDGFGLWAAILKESGEFAGQVGITMQECDGERVPEIGYLFKKQYWHKGYASEAAEGCKNYAFNILGVDKIYSIIRDTNLASQAVARRNGMRPVKTIIKHYYNMDMPHLVFCAEKGLRDGNNRGEAAGDGAGIAY